MSLDSIFFASEANFHLKCLKCRIFHKKIKTNIENNSNPFFKKQKDTLKLTILFRLLI